MSVNFSCIGQPLYGQNQWLALFLKVSTSFGNFARSSICKNAPHPQAAAACGWGFSIVAGTFPCPCVSIGFQPFFFYPFFVFLLPVKHASHRCLIGLGGVRALHIAVCLRTVDRLYLWGVIPGHFGGIRCSLNGYINRIVGTFGEDSYIRLAGGIYGLGSDVPAGNRLIAKLYGGIGEEAQ